jgi:hypothetical protein
VRTGTDLLYDCFTPTFFTDSYVTEFCLASVRNNPVGNNLPAFIAWPVNSE